MRSVGRPLLIVAGEQSGESYGASLVRALRELAPDVAPFGVGGDGMAGAGVELLARVEETAVVGLTEVVSRLAFFRRLKGRILEEAARRQAKVAVLIDFAGFNIRLARELAARGVAVVWYVSPQVWAWRGYRARALGELCREILVVFPFEVEFYRALGIRATFVGHPLAREVAPTGSREALRAELGAGDGVPVLGILPGSRRGELARLVPVIAGALATIRRETGAMPVVAAAPGVEDAALAGLGEVAVRRGRTREILAHADLSLVASGTATVEAALLGAPMLVLYRMSAVTYSVVRRLVKVKYAAMPNLLLDAPVVPELLQDACTSEGVAREAVALLRSSSRREEMRARLLGIRAMLASEDPSAAAARWVASVLDATRA